jgi:pilus assembly protein Flp/PilA
MSASQIGTRIAQTGTPADAGNLGEEINMKDTMLKLYIKFQNLLSQDEGQDLVEYALVVALISVAAVAGLNSVATAIKSVFSSIDGTLSGAL